MIKYIFFNRTDKQCQLITVVKKIIVNLLTVLIILSNISLTPAYGDGTPIKVIVDTDMGVDDAVAVAWLFSQTTYPVDVLGIVSVAGNTSVENATNNVLTILDGLSVSNIPVTIGAAAPLTQTLSRTGAGVHGPDGLWLVGQAHPHDLSGLPTDAASFYCNMANTNPGAVLIALGPLTNLANAINQCEAQLGNFARVVVLGGAIHGGNRTPVAEFNVWQDPEAAAQVLSSTLLPIFIPIDTFRTFNITQDDLDELSNNGIAVTQLIFPALQLYAATQTGLAGNNVITVPDVPAVMYALDDSLGEVQSALIKVIASVNRQFRGQTIVGLDISERLPMIADDQELSDFTNRLLTDPNFDFAAEVGQILAREPDNGQVVTNIKAHKMHMDFLRALTN